MSIGGSEKEYIFSLFLLQNPIYLEEIIGGKLSRIEAEVPVGRKKVDLLAVESSRRLPVYIETQLNQSDPLHLKTIHDILESIREGIVIWIARSFRREHLMQIFAYLKRNKQKYVAFYALEIHPKAIVEVECLNQMYKLDIWNELKRISEIKYPRLKRIESYSQIPPTHAGRETGTVNYDWTRVEDVKQYMLECLREKVPQFLNVWKSKKHNRFDNVLTIGAGRDGVYLKLSAKNQQGFASIRLYFDKSKMRLYNQLKKRIFDLQKGIHPNLSASERKIGILFTPDPDLDVTISNLATILEQMLLYFGSYIYGGYDTGGRNRKGDQRYRHSDLA